MRKVDVEDLEAGMLLATDVDDHNGYRILAKGTVLTRKQIALLTTWHVLEAMVEDEVARQEELGAALSAEDEAIEAARKRLSSRFEGRLENIWMKALHEGAEKRLAVPRFWKTQV